MELHTAWRLLAQREHVKPWTWTMDTLPPPNAYLHNLYRLHHGLALRAWRDRQRAKVRQG
jgi:hypothetical protein